jgi:hypothetical protein
MRTTTMTAGNEKKRRIQLDLAISVADRLDELKVLTGAASNADVIRRALRLYDHVYLASTAGAKVHLEMPNGERREVWLA